MTCLKYRNIARLYTLQEIQEYPTDEEKVKRLGTWDLDNYMMFDSCAFIPHPPPTH